MRIKVTGQRQFTFRPAGAQQAGAVEPAHKVVPTTYKKHRLTAQDVAEIRQGVAVAAELIVAARDLDFT